MMTIIVEVFREFGLKVSERKTETLMMRVKEKQLPLLPSPPLIIKAAGQRYAQTTEFRYLGGLVNEQGDLTVSPQGPPTQGGGSGGHFSTAA